MTKKIKKRKPRKSGKCPICGKEGCSDCDGGC